MPSNKRKAPACPRSTRKQLGIVHSTRLVHHLACGVRLGDNALECELLLLEVVGAGILNFKLSHGIAERSLDLLLLATLEVDGGAWVGNHLLDTSNVSLELLLRLVLLAESLIGALKFIRV
jgi:hypothetical protein